MATAPLTFNIGQTAILMADFHREGMGDNPMVQERGTVHKARAVLEAARQAGVLVVYIVVNFRPGYPEIADRNVIFRERKTSARIPPADPVSLIIPEVQPLPHEPMVVKHRVNAFFGTDLEMIYGRMTSTPWSCWGMRPAESFCRRCAMRRTPTIAWWSWRMAVPTATPRCIRF